jgi:predicted dithiol-disulfide oxidoreductase (DUF899 family)
MQQSAHVARTDWVAARMALVEHLTRLRDQLNHEPSALPWIMTSAPTNSARPATSSATACPSYC